MLDDLHERNLPKARLHLLIGRSKKELLQPIPRKLRENEVE
jgi:hypothetical protein